MLPRSANGSRRTASAVGARAWREEVAERRGAYEGTTSRPAGGVLRELSLAAIALSQQPQWHRSHTAARRGTTAPCRTIAKAEAVRGNAARLLGTPTLCLCKRRDRRSLVARMLLVDGHGVRRWAAEFVAGSRRVTATLAPRRPRARPSPPLPPVTSAPQDLRDVSAVMPVPRLPARPRAAARRLAAATARCASARGRRGRRSRTA